MAEAALQSHVALDGQREEVEEVDDFEPIEKLQELGVGAADIKKAKEGGFYTVQSLIMVTKKKLQAVKGLSEAKAEKMVEAARKVTDTGNWMTGSDAMLKRQREIVKISSGCQAVNELLAGGFETKAITEMYGEYRTGKTQLCLTMCVTTQMPVEDGGAAGKVAFIDTEGTFRPERIIPIAQRFNLEPEAVLNNILFCRAYTSEHQMELIQSVAAKMVEEPFKLLIVDSIMANFRVDFSGRGELADRQQKLGQMMSQLKKVAEEFNVAVVITNQVMSDPGGGMTFVVDPKKPVGGHVMAHASTQRIYLRKGKGEQRVMKVVDSPCLAEAEASFAVGPDGIVDYKE
eukprot:jgi/Chrzof1/5101/Cz15g11140.t1